MAQSPKSIRGTETSIILKTHATAFQAGITYMAHYTKALLRQDTNNQTIAIYLDCQAASKVISFTARRGTLKSLSQLGSQNKITRV